MPSVKFGGRRLLLSASDLVLPLCCGIVLHLFFVISLLITHYFLPTTDCTKILYYYIYAALGCHGLIVLINFIGTSIGVRLKVMAYSVWLTRVLYIRSALNLLDVSIAIWGLYLIIAGDLNCLGSTPDILLIVSVLINWIILFIGCCGVCCLTTSRQQSKQKTESLSEMNRSNASIRTGISRIRPSSTGHLHENDVTTKKIESKLRGVCCACLWENRAWNRYNVDVAFNEMTSMIGLLMETDYLNDVKDLAASDVFTGLQLYRMLQKHYQIHDVKFYQPYNAKQYKHKFLKMESNDILLEVGTDQKKKHKELANNDFISLADTSTEDESKNDKTKVSEIIIPHQLDEKYEKSHSDSHSVTPESPLLTNCNHTHKADGFGTFNADIDYDIKSSEYKAPANDIEKVQSYLYNGIQPALSADELCRVSEGIYFSKYAIAAYGLPLYTLEYPLGILCAMPCCLPSGMKNDSDDRIYGKACCGLSTIKVFLRRAGIKGNDLLLASQFSGLNQITFFIAIDRKKRKVVIAIRGSESMPDGMIDFNCKPTQCHSIDENGDCYAHDGFKLTMLQLFDALEKHNITQTFLANNRDYGIIVTGHSLGAGVSILLTLHLLRNQGNNNNYKRDIHCYGIAAPPSIDTEYGSRNRQRLEQHITCFIYNKDMVPRAQWNSLLQVKCAIMRLLRECDQSSWWVYRQGLSVNNETILNALVANNYVLYDGDRAVRKQSMDYIRNDMMVDIDILPESPKSNAVNSNEEEKEAEEEGRETYMECLNKVHNAFMRDVNNDIKELGRLAVQKNIAFGPSLWNIKLQQIGMIFHIINDNEVNNNSYTTFKEIVCCSCLCSTLCNCCRCKCCNPSSINPLKNDKYIIYRADPQGFNQIIISSRMASDHMPHVYKNVLASLDINKLNKLTNSNKK